MTRLIYKPRVMRLNGRWVVARDWWVFHPTGARCVLPIGEGDTPREAMKDAERYLRRENSLWARFVRFVCA